MNNPMGLNPATINAEAVAAKLTEMRQVEAAFQRKIEVLQLLSQSNISSEQREALTRRNHAIDAELIQCDLFKVSREIEMLTDLLKQAESARSPIMTI
jgi:hypothetical protein